LDVGTRWRRWFAAILACRPKRSEDRIFVQAKRYAEGNNTGAGAIRDFYGALSLKKVHKGIFVTTSASRQPAVDTARGLGSRIVLIDGPQLSRLMIRYNVGSAAMRMCCT
jgi:restriction system protein